jgi:nondiscriminating aspartyl-tRNA synthetase
MKHLSVNELTAHIGKKTTLEGWVQTIRDQGSIIFVILRNEQGTFQGVVPKSSAAFAACKELTHESVIQMTGEAKEQKAAPHGVEVLVDSVTVLSLADALLPIPVSENAENEAEQQKRLDWRWLDLRKPEKRLVFEAWTTMEQAAREHWITNDYLEIHSPKFMGVPSEGSAELFEVEYFGQKAYLAQSPQFYKQMAMASGFNRIFEVGPVFRANPSFTSRHDTEFTGYDMELSYIDSHYDVMHEEEKWLVAMISAVKEKHGAAVLQAYDRDIVVPTLPFPKISLKDAKTLLAKHNISSEKADDLSPEEERTLSELIKKEHGHEFVFVTEYPVSARPFYHMRLETDPTLTKSFDLLWNGIEITTGAQREHRYDQLVAQAKEKGLHPEPLQFYFNFFKYGCPPHGGLGLSPSRLLMKMLNVSNVREVTYLYRGPKRLAP